MCTGAQATGERSRFEEAAFACLPDLLGSALRLTRNWEEAQALTQEALVRACRSFGDLPAGVGFQIWLLTAMVGAHLERGGAASSLGAKRSAGRPPEGPEKAAASEGQPAERIRAALDMLPEELRIPLLLCDVESMSYRDIARALGIPVGAVRARIFTGRQHLQESLME